MLRLGDFLGTWQVSRRIRDARDAREGRFEGRVLFAPEGTGLRYHESGILVLGDGPGLTAARQYLWHETPTGIAVFFEDGRPFHHFTPDGSAEATHWCDPDTYAVRYDFTAWPEWESRWQATGPRKDYVMTTIYCRKA